MPDPKNDKKKKASTKPSSKNAALAAGRKTQLLGDDLAAKVSKKKMTMEQAQAEQAKRDAKKRKTKTVSYTTGKGGEGKSYHTKPKKAKFKRGKDGNLKAY
tara:strand:+ start:62113 stop:62415 length:303 start_codon:yes stop_codon:yes gene_type:complete